MGGSQSASNTPAGSSANVGNGPYSFHTKPKVVVIPVDASKHAEAAFLWYLKHVHRPENTVRIIHCQELAPSSPVMMEHTFKTDSWVEMMERARNQGKSLVDKYEEKLKENKVEGSVHFEVGKPGEIVVNSADKFGATHIVMGTRGFGMIRRTILGSVSEYVVHHTKVPVTVVPKETQNWFF